MVALAPSACRDAPMENSRASLSREDWIEAARLVLTASGVDDVKIDRLAKKLTVSRGSFYWHFKHRKDLLDALLSAWESQNRHELAQIRERAGQVDTGVMEAVRIWLGEDLAYPTFDMAIRFWARKSPEVGRLVRSIDDEWIKLLATIFEQSGEDRMTALARARVNYFHQIGYYALAFEESLEDRLALAPYYHRVLTGRDGGQPLAATIEYLRTRDERNCGPHD